MKDEFRRVDSGRRYVGFRASRSLRLFNPNRRSSSLVVDHPDTPRSAAHLEILDVLLRRTAARVQADHDFLTAVGTNYLSFGVEHDIVCQGIRADMTSLIVVIAVTEHGRLLYHPLTATIYTHPIDQEMFDQTGRCLLSPVSGPSRLWRGLISFACDLQSREIFRRRLH